MNSHGRRGCTLINTDSIYMYTCTLCMGSPRYICSGSNKTWKGGNIFIHLSVALFAKYLAILFSKTIFIFHLRRLFYRTKFSYFSSSTKKFIFRVPISSAIAFHVIKLVLYSFIFYFSFFLLFFFHIIPYCPQNKTVSFYIREPYVIRFFPTYFSLSFRSISFGGENIILNVKDIFFHGLINRIYNIFKHAFYKFNRLRHPDFFYNSEKVLSYTL